MYIWNYCLIPSLMRNRTFIVAELSANHNQDFELAVKSIEAISKTGVDAVKLQTFKPDSFTMDVNNGYFGPRKNGLWKGMRPIELYTRGAMPYDWQPRLMKIANDLGLVCFSSPFDYEAVDFMEEMGMPIYKVASLEITDTILIRYIARKQKPVMISTGAASAEDIELALKICRDEGNDRITLLKCTSEYPAPIEKANLLTLPDMRQRFGVEVGVSDHSMTNTIPLVSVALGATVVEKHFILDRSLGGIDSAFSLNPAEFSRLVEEIREVEKALGEVSYELKEEDRLRRRSLFISKDIKAGEILTTDHVKSVRPGYGLHPKYLPEILGKKVNKNLKRGMRINMEDIL